MDYEEIAYNSWAGLDKPTPQATRERQSTSSGADQTSARTRPALVTPGFHSQAGGDCNGVARIRDHPPLSGPHQRGPALTSQQKWLSQGAKKRETNLRGQPAALVDIVDGFGKDGEAAWRNHQPPADSTSAPAELGWQGQELEQIAQRFGTFISTQKNTGSGYQIRCDIWGEPTAVAHTKQAITDWIKREMPSKHTQGIAVMPKSKSLLPQQHAQEEKRWKREVKKQKYRQAPPLGTRFGAIATFHWPMEEYRPEDVLGRNYEALDTIRMECSCYIIFDKNLLVFQLLGENKPVKQALLRMRVVCFQVAARQLTPIRLYLLHFPGEVIPKNISLAQYEHANIFDATNEATGQVGQSPHGEGVMSDEAAQKQIMTKSSRNIKHVQRCFANISPRLHYYRGHIELRIRLGRFLATQYIQSEEGIYSLEEYQDMIQQPQFSGEVTAELGDRDEEFQALARIQKGGRLLTPLVGTLEKLYDVRPVYTVIFTFTDQAGDIRLTIQWHEQESGPGPKDVSIAESSRKWLRLDRGSEVATPLIDISLCNLKNSTAWQFDLATTQAVDMGRLPGSFRSLAKSISVDPIAMRSQRTSQPWVRWNSLAPIKLLQQRVGHRYGLGTSDYTVELTRFQDRVFTGKPIRSSNGATYEPRWSLEVYHNSWDTMFTTNERVAVGEEAVWDGAAASWFPEGEFDVSAGPKNDSKGFKQLLAKLGELEAIVMKSGVETYGGTEVG